MKNHYLKSVCSFTLIVMFASITFGQSALSNHISGNVTFADKPLTSVNISIKNTDNGTQSDAHGFYEIAANIGDIIQYSYLGMKPIEVIVEDQTKVLNIEMREIENALNEVVIDRDVKLMPTYYGKINPLAGSKTYIKGSELIQGLDLYQAITMRMPFRSTGSITLNANLLWDIDEMLFTDPPYIDVSQIEDIVILRSLSDLVKYGTAGRGGVVVIRTKNRFYLSPEKKAQEYTNKNMYQHDAEPLVTSNFNLPNDLNFLTTITNSEFAFNTFNSKAEAFKNNPSYFIDAAKYFAIFHSDTRYAKAILSKLNSFYSDDAEILKAIAYEYEAIDLPQEAIKTYQQIIKLRPTYAQSFRDLANAYTLNDDDANAWKYYMNYLFRGNQLDYSGIGEIMYNEMEAIYTKKNNLKINEKFELRDGEKFDKDIRIVAEWNTSEAEFKFEFVNPENQSYQFKHSLYDDNSLIVNEKTMGYTSKEFFIDHLDKGDWLVNLTYLGNKTNQPTFMKVTIFQNWERPNQTKKTIVMKLTDVHKKFNLFKLNSKKLDGQNNLKLVSNNYPHQ